MTCSACRSPSGCNRELNSASARRVTPAGRVREHVNSRTYCLREPGFRARPRPIGQSRTHGYERAVHRLPSTPQARTVLPGRAKRAWRPGKEARKEASMMARDRRNGTKLREDPGRYRDRSPGRRRDGGGSGSCRGPRGRVRGHVGRLRSSRRQRGHRAQLGPGQLELGPGRAPTLSSPSSPRPRQFSQTTHQGKTLAVQRGIVVLATKKFLILQSSNGSLHLWLLSGSDAVPERLEHDGGHAGADREHQRDAAGDDRRAT